MATTSSTTMTPSTVAPAPTAPAPTPTPTAPAPAPTATAPAPTATATSVRFAEDNNVVIHIDCLTNMSTSDKIARWYTRGEMDRNQSQDELMYTRIVVKGEESSEEFSSRGLDRGPVKQSEVLEYVQRVLEEQDRQKFESVRDENLLAEVSRKLSNQYRRAARKLGKADEEEVSVSKERRVSTPTTKQLRKQLSEASISTTTTTTKKKEQPSGMSSSASNIQYQQQHQHQHQQKLQPHRGGGLSSFLQNRINGIRS